MVPFPFIVKQCEKVLIFLSEHVHDFREIPETAGSPDHQVLWSLHLFQSKVCILFSSSVGHVEMRHQWLLQRAQDENFGSLHSRLTTYAVSDVPLDSLLEAEDVKFPFNR